MNQPRQGRLRLQSVLAEIASDDEVSPRCPSRMKRTLFEVFVGSTTVEIELIGGLLEPIHD
jgi:hypothetical protein